MRFPPVFDTSMLMLIIYKIALVLLSKIQILFYFSFLDFNNSFFHFSIGSAEKYKKSRIPSAKKTCRSKKTLRVEEVKGSWSTSLALRKIQNRQITTILVKGRRHKKKTEIKRIQTLFERVKLCIRFSIWRRKQTIIEQSSTDVVAQLILGKFTQAVSCCRLLDPNNRRTNRK